MVTKDALTAQARRGAAHDAPTRDANPLSGAGSAADGLSETGLGETGLSETGLSETAIWFKAADGYRLSGVWIRPSGPARARALISAATGFPKEFYARFARDAARRGIACLLFDYRGIGGSAPEDLAAMRVDYTDWGRLDMPAAIDALTADGRDVASLHVGHSVGGHMVGFASNHGLLDRHAFVSVGSGYWAKHHLRSIPLELLFWWGYGPASLALTGAVTKWGPWRGESLPRGVFTTWRRWCHTPRYFRDELHDRLAPHWFEAVRAPIRSWVFTDDPIATPSAADDMLALYPNAPREMIVRAPGDYGVTRIGHEGAFRSAATRIWDEVWAWAAPD